MSDNTWKVVRGRADRGNGARCTALLGRTAHYGGDVAHRAMLAAALAGSRGWKWWRGRMKNSRFG